jgi:hypothetical protein
MKEEIEIAKRLLEVEKENFLDRSKALMNRGGFVDGLDVIHKDFSYRRLLSLRTIVSGNASHRELFSLRVIMSQQIPPRSHAKAGTSLDLFLSPSI